MNRDQRDDSLALVTFGCQMNQLDSELLAGRLAEAGWKPGADWQRANVVLFNTCSVRDHAEERVRGRLRQLAARRPPPRVLGVLGCFAQRAGRRLVERYPGVNLVVGPDRLAAVPGMLAALLNGEPGPLVDVERVPGGGGGREPGAPLAARPRRFQASLAVMRGCGRRCAYCVVPATRGPARSRAPGEIEAEAARLVGDGCRELTLVGQNIDGYGRDRPGGESLAALLARLDRLPGLRRLRFLTSHPADLDDDVLRAMAGLKSVCPWLHLPVQSGSDRILAAMGRGYTGAEYRARLARARDLVPELEIATDFIVGFPGEGEAEFAASLALCREEEFCQSFVFKYSPRPGTRAAALADDVPPAEKRDRNQRLLAAQAEGGRARRQRQVGRELPVLVEGPSRTDRRRATGRTRSNLQVVFSGRARPGEEVPVRITACSELTLFGERA